MFVTQLINDNGNPASNQFVISTKKGVVFQSYDSPVALVNNSGKLTLAGNWDYSNTTRKHLYIFLRQNGFSLNCRKDVLKAIRSGEVKLIKSNVLKIAA